MNVLGAFSFGALIKTFFPGLVWILAIALLEDNICRMIGCERGVLFDFMVKQSNVTLLLAIPVGIVLGVLSNIVVFMGLNDMLVRRPIEKREPRLMELYRHAGRQLLGSYSQQLGSMTPEMQEVYYSRVDAEVVALGRLDLAKVAHVREQYWYYMEFCMNLLLAGTFVAIGLVWEQLLVSAFGYAILILLGWSVLAAMLFFAARKNYCRHICKMTSLLVAALPQS